LTQAAAAALVFLAGLLAPVKLNVLGEIYLVEVLLPAVAMPALLSRAGRDLLRSRAFRHLLWGAALTLAGYVLSDVFRGTRPDQYLRGWGRVLLVMSDFLCLALLAVRNPRNIWWFVLGVGLGRVAELRFVEHLPLPMWKFGYAEPMLLVAAALGAMLPRRVAALWFVVLAYLSAKYDFRTFVLLGLVLAAFSWHRGPAPGSSLRLGRNVALGGAIAGAALVGYLSLALIGGDYWTSRRATSNAGREAAMQVGWIAISRSPLIGYGSWPESPELATLYRKLTYDALGANWLNPSVGDAVFTPHSQILQAWMEGGILGAAFFFVLLWQVAKQLPYVLFRRPRDALSTILVYYLATGLLNIFISPFSAPHRVGIAVVAACLVLLAAERARAKLQPGMAISSHGPRPAIAVRRRPSPPAPPGFRPLRRPPPPSS